MIALNPESRPSIPAILAHPWSPNINFALEIQQSLKDVLEDGLETSMDPFLSQMYMSELEQDLKQSCLLSDSIVEDLAVQEESKRTRRLTTWIKAVTGK